jgi:DNA-binding MarR family transcriptional regulator
MSARHREIGSRFGVTGSQRLVVRIIGQTPGVSAGEVARVLHVHPSTLTPTLQTLIERGLVRREAHRDDRRRAVLSLTRRGEKIDAASAELIDKAVRGALARLAGSEVFAARRVLHTVAAAVGGETDPGRALVAGSRRSRATRALSSPGKGVAVASERSPSEAAARPGGRRPAGAPRNEPTAAPPAGDRGSRAAS